MYNFSKLDMHEYTFGFKTSMELELISRNFKFDNEQNTFSVIFESCLFPETDISTIVVRPSKTPSYK